jgi:transcriptional regulator GlxA family with amidase domain
VLRQILLYDGFDELDAVAPYEVLQIAAALGAPGRVELVTLDGAPEVTGAYGLQLRPQARFEPGSRPDLLLVPGGGWVARVALGVRAEMAQGTSPAAVADGHRAGATVAAVCTGVLIHASAGLLRGRPAATHPAAVDALRASGAEIIAARVVDDGDVVTSGGVTSGFDLALWLDERFAGAQLASAVEKSLQYERRGTVWRRAPVQ